MSNENLQKQDGGHAEPTNVRVQPLLQWRVYKYEPLEKLPWLRIAGASGMLTLIALVLLLQKSYFGVATFLAAAVVVALFLIRKPPIASCAILPDAIVFQNQRHLFTDLDGFAMTVGRLIIFPKTKNSGATIHIPIDPEDGDEIQDFLVAHLEPKEYEATLLDVLEEFLRI